MAPARTPIRVMLTLLCIAAAACGDRNGRSGERAPAARGPAAPSCPDAGFISTTIGVAVRSRPDASRSEPGTLLCAYQTTDKARGAFVSIAVAPLSPGEDAMAEIRASARAVLGEQADAEPIDVGDRGYAYGSSSKSGAAAIRQSRVYRVDVTSVTGAPLGDRKAAVVTILRKVVG
jgi:hypothetical protein